MSSFRAHFAGAFAVGATLATNALQFTLTPTTSPANDTGAVALTAAHDFSKYQPDDYIHISFKLDKPANFISGRLLIDVDATTNNFTQNYYEYIFTATQLPNLGNASFHELFIKVANLQRIGDDANQTLRNIAAISIEFTVSAVTIATVSSWWAGGTYGPDAPPGTINGIQYRYRYRASTTGAQSMPGPATRFGLFPLRQQVVLSVVASTDPQVDTIDVERLDPLLQAPAPAAPVWTYVFSVPNSTATGQQDNYSASAIAANPALPTNVLQPFPVLGPPLSGTVNVVGTQVTLTAGNNFPLNLVAATAILIHGVAYQTYGQPTATTLQLASNAGVQTGVGYTIASPVLAGTPLPYMFGPLEGPTASFAFAIGDINNPGTLYWTNGNDMDSAASTNSVEVTPPSEPLVSGCVWNTYVFVASRLRLFMIQPTFDQANVFTPLQIPAPSGVWTPWTMTSGMDGVYYLGRDGLYRALPYSGAQPISPDLWPIFPHEGNPGMATNGLNPVNMDTATPGRIQPRVCVVEQDVYFNYTDTLGAQRTLRWMPVNLGGAQPARGWWPEVYANPVQFHYWEETPFGQNPRLLQATTNGFVMQGQGVLDNAAQVNCTIQTPSYNSGDSRAQKLYMDMVTDLVSGASMTLGFNWNDILLPGIAVAPVTQGTPRGLSVNPVDTILYANPNLAVNLPIYQNVSARYTWQATAGTTIYEFQPCFYPQPYVVENVVTQFTDHGIPGWKIARWGRFAYISSQPLELTITCDEDLARPAIYTTSQYTLPAHLHLYTYEFNTVSNPQKGRMYGYNLRSPNCVPFVLFREETYIRMKGWKGGEFAEVRPFLDGP